MANIVYDYLAESFLFDEKYLDEDYRRFTDSELKSELIKYREHVNGFSKVLHNEVTPDNNMLNITTESFSTLPNENLLKQLSLYMDTVIVPDPIYSIYCGEYNKNQVVSQMLEIKNDTTINRERLRKSIEYMKKVTPLVARDFIKFYPLEFIREPEENIPLYFDENNFRNALPNELIKYFIDKVDVRNVLNEKGSLIVDPNRELTKGTLIRVNFKDDESLGMIYQYMTSKVLSYDDQTRKVKFAHSVPDSITDDEFDNWIENTVNRTAIRKFTDVMSEFSLVRRLGNMYLAKSEITDGILKRVVPSDVKSEVANLSMQLDLPVVNELSIEDIIRVRYEIGESFHDFRTVLNTRLLELRLVKDGDELSKRMDILQHELSEVQVRKVNQEIKKYIVHFGIDTALVIGSLVTNFYSGDLSKASAMLALGKGAGDIQKYNQNVKRNDGYFMWKLNKQK